MIAHVLRALTAAGLMALAISNQTTNERKQDPATLLGQNPGKAAVEASWVPEIELRAAMRQLAKPGLLLFSKSDCQPCERLEKLLSKPNIREALAGFVCCRMPQGRAKAWRVSSFPSLVFCDIQGKLCIVAVNGERSQAAATTEKGLLAQLSGGIAATEGGLKK